MTLGVHLDMTHARNDLGYLTEHPSGRAARLAERRRELQERGPLPQLRPDVGRSDPVTGCNHPVLPRSTSKQDAGEGRDHQGHDQNEHTGHVELQVS